MKRAGTTLNRLVGILILLAMARVGMGAETPVSLVVDTGKAGEEIGKRFVGVSFETKIELPGSDGKYFFRGDNEGALKMFKGLGIRSLRVGGNTADRATEKIPQEKEIDSLYAFAKAGDMEVIYTLRLKDVTDLTENVRLAKYIWEHYRGQTAAITIGNEPNVYLTKYEDYLAAWKKQAEAIVGAVPDVVLNGPSATPGKVAWSHDFVKDVASGPLGKNLRMVTQHSYPGGNAEKLTDDVAGREHLLSLELDEGYQKFYDTFVPAVNEAKLPWRLEEANSIFHGGGKNISNTFAATLWGLDYLHWWAAHGCGGINLHTFVPVVGDEERMPGGYSVMYQSPSGLHLTPMGYAVKAFDLGGHGKVVPVEMKTEKGVNVTAYAASHSGFELCVTVINKENGKEARDAAVTIDIGKQFYDEVSAAAVAVPGNDVSVLKGMTIGGSEMKSDGTWEGKWERLKLQDGRVLVRVPAGSAKIVTMVRFE